MSLPSAENRFGAFRHSSYRRFFSARFFSAFAIQIVSVSVGWQMYEVTGNAFYLGLIGLFQFLPSLLLILVTGTVADRRGQRARAPSRRKRTGERLLADLRPRGFGRGMPAERRQLVALPGPSLPTHHGSAVRRLPRSQPRRADRPSERIIATRLRETLRLPRHRP